MREMKSSGLPWVDNIPENWEIARGKEILTLLSRPVEPRDGVITCFRDGEVTLRSKRRELGFTFSTQETGYQGIEPGDLVIHGMDGFAGSIGISDSRGKATPVLNVMDSNQNKKYLMYYFRAIAKAGYFESVATGIRVRTCDTNWNKISVTPCLVPPLDEQSRIASFLDSHIAKIDDSIARYKALSDKLDEYRKAVITKAVMEGVQKNRNMKSHFIDWYENSPSDWEKIKLKYCISDYLEKNDPVICTDILSLNNKGQVLPYKERGNQGNKSKEKLTDYKIAQPGTLVVNSMNVIIGSSGISNYRGCVSPVYYVYIPKDNTNLRYLYYIFQTKVFQKELRKYANGILEIRLRISSYDMLQILIPHPSIIEQAKIVSYLDKKCCDIERSKEKIEAIIKKLEDYKKSLIYNAVTGKIEC